MPTHPDLRRTLGRGELVRVVYRLGCHGASGVVTASAPGLRDELFVLRRGRAIAGDGELAVRALRARLARLASCDPVTVAFAGGVTAYPPGAVDTVSLAGWARGHLEQQLDAARADALVGELAGARLALRRELAPEPVDDADRRMLAALAQPRRLDQIWSLARAPRFRLLALLHFLRAVGALDGVAPAAAAPPPPPADPQRAARRLLGVPDDADPDAVKRAYRRLARALHPDLQPAAAPAQRRALERRFAEVTAAYDWLTGHAARVG